MITYRSNGKLLLTAEYVVLDGAKALALPTKFGQTLNVKPINAPNIIWKSLDKDNNIWFEETFEISNGKLTSLLQNQNSYSERLIQILNAVNSLNSNFLSFGKGFEVITHLEFTQNWGLGSSSTLINNIANWANVDAYKLLHLTFGGSGYDIACAQHNNPIAYSINKENESKTVEPITFNPSFKDNLFFVHLNQKQDSREGIMRYNQKKNRSASTISEINSITNSIIDCKTISEFKNLITNHEQVISKLIDLPTVKSTKFIDYSGAIKSLGAWGGDFILATGKFSDMHYFKQKGYHTIIPYTEMIL